MKVEMVTKIIHYCMSQNDDVTANSFLQSYIAECIRNNKKEDVKEDVKEEIKKAYGSGFIINSKGKAEEVFDSKENKGCATCKYKHEQYVKDSHCPSCLGHKSGYKNWEPIA